ncbi:MAG: tetratricopeptide repeat protein [Planctomycetes bacterium]|nr:tetratricopeptide repeat protein [Planctomycetota bacterium]
MNALIFFLLFQQQPSEQVSKERSFLVKFSLEKPESIKSKVLWITRDLGQTWQSDGAYLKNLKYVMQDKHVYVYLEVIEDGKYGFYLQLEDEAGNKSPDPTVETIPQIYITVDTVSPVIKLKRKEKYVSNTLTAEISFVYQETTEIKERLLWWSRDGRDWNRSTDTSEVKVNWIPQGNEMTANILVESEGKYWFSIQLVDIAGNRTPAPTNQLAEWIEIEFSPFSPQIVIPIKYDTLTVPNIYVIKWYSPVTLPLKEKATSLYFRKKLGEWVKIGENLENSGIYLWSPPLEDTLVSLKMEVMDTKGNLISSPVVSDIRLRHEKEGNVKRAVDLYKVARLYMAQKDYDKALTNYYLILDEWSSYPLALNDIANIYYEKGEKEKSLEFFYRAVSSDKANPKYYLNVAICLFDLMLYDNVLDSLQNAVALETSSDPSIPTKAAVMLIKLNEKVASKESKEKLKQIISDILKRKIIGKELLKQLTELGKMEIQPDTSKENPVDKTAETPADTNMKEPLVEIKKAEEANKENEEKK